MRQKRHQRDCPTVLFLTRVHEFHSYTNAPSRTAAKLTRRSNSIFQGLRPTKNHTENAIGASSWSWICATNWEWDHDNLSDGFAKSRRVEVLTVSKPRKCDSLFPAFLPLVGNLQATTASAKTSIIRRPWKGAPGTARDPFRVPERLGRLTEATLRAHSAARARSPSIDAGGGARKAP